MKPKKLTLGLAMLGLASSACAVVISPNTYDMLNGNTGTYNYWDQIYTGSGNTTLDNSPLSGGKGDLTDGVIAGDNWFVTEAPPGNGPYVGWTLNPTITFHFGAAQLLNTVTLYLDDSDGAGGVSAPASIDISLNGGPVVNYPVAEPSGSTPFSVTFPLGFASDVAITLNRKNQWVFLSEVSFDGQGTGSVPDTGSTLSLFALGCGLAAVLRRKFAN
jgi:hypothetical protein